MGGFYPISFHQCDTKHLHAWIGLKYSIETGVSPNMKIKILICCFPIERVGKNVKMSSKFIMCDVVPNNYFMLMTTMLYKVLKLQG